MTVVMDFFVLKDGVQEKHFRGQMKIQNSKNPFFLLFSVNFSIKAIH